MVLGSALASGSPSHAYLFHGPPGTGKRTAARALAAELLAEGEDDPDAARMRALHGTHPDLTWVRPTGAHVMRVSDVEGPVVAAAGRTPFESRRRVFVLERVDGVVADREQLRGKPAPDTFLAAARALGVEPAVCAVFEDALAGVEAGRAGGFRFVVGVDRAGHAEALRAHGADVVVADLGDLLPATPGQALPGSL